MLMDMSMFMGIEGAYSVVDMVTPASTEPKLNTIPLVYPNPLKLRTGGHLGYRLSVDMDMEIRIFNIRGYEVYRDFYRAGVDEGAIGFGNTSHYNRIPLNSSNLGGLPSGAYFFILIYEGKVIGKGKFAIRP